jgi:hypothetical protein
MKERTENTTIHIRICILWRVAKIERKERETTETKGKHRTTRYINVSQVYIRRKPNLRGFRIYKALQFASILLCF